VSFDSRGYTTCCGEYDHNIGAFLGCLECDKITKEECKQETIPFEDETIVAGKKYPLLVTPSGLFMFKNEIPPEEPKSLDLNPEHKVVLFVPNKSKGAKQKFRKIKMHPMTGVAIRSKTADKD
jgi:hypothetical protein